MATDSFFSFDPTDNTYNIISLHDMPKAVRGVKRKAAVPPGGTHLETAIC
jgi:hypothetical protein